MQLAVLGSPRRLPKKIKAQAKTVEGETKMKKKVAKSLPLLALAIIMAATAAPAVAAPPGPTIVDVAISVNSEGPYAGAFDTLIAAVLAADPAIINTLSGNGQFTVFAPTDAAFEAIDLNPDNVGDLDPGFLADVLLYHVARGRRDSTDVIGSERIRTLQRGFLLQDGGKLTDALGREATIIVPDVPAANGIIHAINAVVLPYAPSP
jgi:uncharacterized surface protein with fasciclin (FAS1) repeats